MKKIAILVFAVLISTLPALSGWTLPGLGKIKNPVTDIKEKANARLNAEVASAAGITGLSRKMMFNIVYAQIFFIGGFGADYYALAETEGTIWRLSTVDSEGNKSAVDAERVLLKKLPDGSSWWFLSWKSRDETWEFEVLMDKDLLARKIRYYNEDVKRIQESVFNYTEKNSDPESETAPPQEAHAGSLQFSDLNQYSMGRESIKVGAKTFACERIEWPFYSEEEGVTYTYTWWVDSSTAGGLIKYEWTKSDAVDMVRGELVSIKKGYKTKFKSF